MSKILFVPVMALVVSLFSVSPATAAVAFAPQIKHANAAAATALHKAHLERALAHILVAEGAGKSGQFKHAEASAAAAIKELHAASAHHQHHQHLHHFHHTHIQSALADLHKAEHQFKAGHIGTAEKDLAKAAAQVNQSLVHHHNNHQLKK